MNEFLVILLVVTAIFALCLLGMAVGVIFRNRCFTSCGHGKVTFRGVTIRCPGCTERECKEGTSDIESGPSATGVGGGTPTDAEGRGPTVTSSVS